ncbi:hypothetical protein O0L34_g12392 [Tuta absoluta]|nr:hypothetical protein O0L34_g12392 [Tuta absoluta]
MSRFDLLIVLLVVVGTSNLAPIIASMPSSDADVAEQFALEIIKRFPQSERRSALINQALNTLVNQTIFYFRNLVNNGSELFNFPPLDPLFMKRYHLIIPSGLINLNMDLEDVYATGFGRFESENSSMDISSLVFVLDIMVPRIEIRGRYDLTGDLFTALTLIGKGDAEFIIESFRFGAMFYLRQSDNRNSTIIDRAEDVHFDIPYFKSNLTGVIGGSNIDDIVNEVLEEIVLDYVNRFRGAIALVAGHGFIKMLNPILNQLNTWRYLAPFMSESSPD